MAVAESEEAISELLARWTGRAATSYEDAESGQVTISVYLSRPPAAPEALLAKLKAGIRELTKLGVHCGRVKASITRLRARDWAESWKRHFKPLRIGDRLLIQPSWIKPRASERAEVIVLDPGLSFGTGQHPTTAFCLTQIVALRRADKRQSMWDVGTGSGILSIAAERLGYSPVDALDNDPEAVRAARANARRNSARIQVASQDLGRVSKAKTGSYDVICANLLADLLIAHRDTLLARLKPDGVLVAAGILKKEFSRVQRHFEQAGLRLSRGQSKGEWRSGAFRIQ
jgi:ribosomal protein L11 methyltransferase